LLRRVLFATRESIEGPTEETIDFLRAAGVDIAVDGDERAGAERRRGRRGGGGRESDRNGFKGCYAQ
jgi:hypothetical protein